MHTRLSFILLMCGQLAEGQSVDSASILTAERGSTMTIRGTTTIGARWQCTAPDVPATAVVVPSPGAPAARDLRWVSVTVPVTSLRCQSGPMERAMRKAMRAERDPGSAIVGHFTTDPGREPQAGAAHLAGTLTVAGVTRNVSLEAGIEPLSDSTFRVRSTVQLTLSAFHITPPRVLFGAVRARDAIAIDVLLLYRR